MQHRVRIAGARTFPFDTQAVDAVFEISRGNLRAIDQLARKSRELAAQKAIATVDPSLVAEARPYASLPVGPDAPVTEVGPKKPSSYDIASAGDRS